MYITNLSLIVMAFAETNTKLYSGYWSFSLNPNI